MMKRISNMETTINEIVCKYLNEKQIEENYQKAYCKHFPYGGYDMGVMDRVVKECREMALKEVPQTAFSPGQLVYIRNVWEIKI